MSSDGYLSPDLTSAELAAAIAEPSVDGKMKLYWDVIPPPSQAALLTLSCLPELLDRLTLVRVNVMRSQQLEAAFRAISPLHQIPLIQESDGSILTESRAMMIYFAELAGEQGRELYPAEPRARAACHRWMLFDVTCLYPRLKDYHMPVMEGRAGRMDETALPALHDALGALDKELQRHPYVAGGVLTLADLSLVVTVVQARAVGVELSEHRAVTAWYARLQGQLPGLRQAERGSAEYAATLRQVMNAWCQKSSGKEGGSDCQQVQTQT